MSSPLIRESLRLPLAFFASGAAALLFEVLWFRALGRVLGNTVWAGALVLTAFMLGIALGGILAARWAERVRRPALAFAAAEITVALSGGLLVWGLPAAEPVIGDWLSSLAGHSTALSGLRLGLALAAMLVPTTAMGTTLALGVRVLGRQDTARALGTLYAANTFGACLAPLFAEYYLIGALGLSGTAGVAAALDLAAAGLALLQNSPSAPPAPATARPDRSPARLLAAAALAGGLALALEVIWFRLLLLYAPATDTTFALMLTLLLAGIAAGGALAPLLAPLRIAWIAAGCGLAVVLGYALTLPASSGLPQIIHYAIPLMLPAAALSGALFTLLGAELRVGSHNPQAPIGKLVSANTLGGACGSALAAFVLLPRLGIESSLLLLAAGYALLPLLFVERRAWKPVLPAALAALGLLLFPVGRIQAHLAQAARVYESLDGASVLEITQGPTVTLQLLKRERFGEPVRWRLLTDSYSMTAINRTSLRYMQLFAWLPLSLHPAPQRALLISYGAGNTARALLDEPELASLTIVDVSPEILAASRTIHGAESPLLDPRVNVVLEDGRHFLRTHRDQFDLITGEPPPPAMAGVVNLYTREYFGALAARLAPGGLATYWLPLHQFQPRGARAVIAAFCKAFADCSLWSGTDRDWILLGGRDFQARPSLARFTRLWRDGARGPRLAASGLEHPEQLGATFLADAAQLKSWYGDSPVLDDDHPKRIAAEIGLEQASGEYARWLAPEDAHRRFVGSTWVAEHWPPELARATEPYFDLQPFVDGQIGLDPVGNLPLVDALLKKTDLSVPVLWLLGSDVPEQRVLSRRLRGAGPEERNRPEYAYTLGAGALASRNYAEAAVFLSRAAGSNPELAGAPAAYALCRAGRAKQAAEVPGAERLAPELRCWRAR